VYPNAEGYGRIPLGMSLIMTILMNEGHEVELFDVSFIMQDNNLDTAARQKIGVAKDTDTSHLYNRHTIEEIDSLFVSKIKDFSPDLVAYTVVEDNYRYCHRLLKLAKTIDCDLPSIVGGSTPSIAAGTVIENPYIDYLMQGEGEIPMKEFCAAMDRGGDVTKTPNLWYKNGEEIHHNDFAPLTDLDQLPIQNLDLWDDAHFVKAYDGKLYRSGSVEMSRGCPQKCTYCINESWRNTFYETESDLIRKKSVSNTIKEIKFLKKKHNLNMFFFCDDNFLALTREKMEEFKEQWIKEINLPYWLNTTVESVTDWRLAALKESGCAGIGIGVESGNEWLRNHILKRNTRNGNESLVDTFNLISEYGIRTTANAMVGTPGETEADLYETVKLTKRMKPSSYSYSFVAPYMGTPIHLLAKDQKLIETETQPGFNGMAKEIGMRKGVMIKNPYITNERIIEIVGNFVDYVTGKLPIPDEFLVEAPGTSPNACKRKESLEEAQFITDVFEKIEQKQEKTRKDEIMANREKSTKKKESVGLTN